MDNYVCDFMLLIEYPIKQMLRTRQEGHRSKLRGCELTLRLRGMDSFVFGAVNYREVEKRIQPAYLSRIAAALTGPEIKHGTRKELVATF